MIIHTQSYPRAAIIGNPSDGYHGKTIAFVFSNFSASVTLYESPELEIIPAEIDLNTFRDLHHLARHVDFSGYYGGVRLIKATIKVFYDYCIQNKLKTAEKNFTIRYATDIPQRLGLAGSSAIITAAMKALMQFYDITIPREILANLVLSVETRELGISAGLQDRVAQAYEHPVFMDFDKSRMDVSGYGMYIPLNPTRLPNFYIAYRSDQSEGSEVTHNTLKARYEMKDTAVLQAIEEWSSLSEQMKEALETGMTDHIPALMNRNFDLRNQILNISRGNQEMIHTARSAGASAKFTGSGGAIIGTYTDEIMYNVLKIKLGQLGVQILKPRVVINQEFTDD